MKRFFSALSLRALFRFGVVIDDVIPAALARVVIDRHHTARLSAVSLARGVLGHELDSPNTFRLPPPSEIQ